MLKSIKYKDRGKLTSGVTLDFVTNVTSVPVCVNL